MKDTLTKEEIRRAVKALEASSEPRPLVWIENEHFYRSEVAEAGGFKCTEDEIAAAKANESGYIKTARGVELYLTKNLPAVSNWR